MLFFVNCEWGAWSSQSCSKTCDTGELVKTRNKTIEEAHGGACNGQATETESCNEFSCSGNDKTPFYFPNENSLKRFKIMIDIYITFAILIIRQNLKNVRITTE